jgi:hypothetical protein
MLHFFTPPLIRKYNKLSAQEISYCMQECIKNKTIHFDESGNLVTDISNVSEKEKFALISLIVGDTYVQKEHIYDKVNSTVFLKSGENGTVNKNASIFQNLKSIKPNNQPMKFLLDAGVILEGAVIANDYDGKQLTILSGSSDAVIGYEKIKHIF